MGQRPFFWDGRKTLTAVSAFPHSNLLQLEEKTRKATGQFGLTEKKLPSSLSLRMFPIPPCSVHFAWPCTELDHRTQ